MLKNLRLEREPYPHLRDDDGCVLAADFIDEKKVAALLSAVNDEPRYTLAEAKAEFERLAFEDIKAAARRREERNGR